MMTPTMDDEDETSQGDENDRTDPHQDSSPVTQEEEDAASTAAAADEAAAPESTPQQQQHNDRSWDASGAHTSAGSTIRRAGADAHDSVVEDVTVAPHTIDDLEEDYPEETEASSVLEGYSTHEEEEEMHTEEEEEEEDSIGQENANGHDPSSATGDDDHDDTPGTNSSSSSHDDRARGHHFGNRSNNNNSNHGSELDLELGLPLDDLDSDNDDNSIMDNSNNNNPAIHAGDDDNNNNNNTTTPMRRCRLRTWQWIRFFLHVILFPVLVLTSVAIPVVIVMFCFALMFVALVVLLCVYYCCSPRRGDQAPVPFHVLIRQILEAVEDETGAGAGDPHSSDTPKYSREEIQNALVRRTLVDFQVTDPAGTIVEDEEPTDEATREDRMHQDMFPVILPPEVSAATPSIEANTEDDDNDDSAHNNHKKKGAFRGIRKRLSSRRQRKASKKKVEEDEVEHNKTYELRLAPEQIMFQTDPAASHSKLFLLKRTYVFSPPLQPEKVKVARDNNDTSNNNNNSINTNNIDTYDVDPVTSGARTYDIFGDDDSSSSSTDFFPVLPSSSSSSSSSSDDEASSRASAQSSNVSFLIDDSNNNEIPPTGEDVHSEERDHVMGDSSRSHSTFHPEDAAEDDEGLSDSLQPLEAVPPTKIDLPAEVDLGKKAVNTVADLEVGVDVDVDLETGLVKDPAVTKMIMEDPSGTTCNSRESTASYAAGIQDTEKGAICAVSIVTEDDKSATSGNSLEAPPSDSEKGLATSLDAVPAGNNNYENELGNASIPDAPSSPGEDLLNTSEPMEETKTEVSLTGSSTEETNQPSPTLLDGDNGSLAAAVPPMENSDAAVNDSATPTELESPSSQSQSMECEHRGISSYCNICLHEYEVGDIVVWSRRPNGCHHAWHEDCLLDWLRRKPTCPNCRQAFFAIEDAPEQEFPVPAAYDDDNSDVVMLVA